MVEILWHRRETRRQKEKTNINLTYREKSGLLDSIQRRKTMEQLNMTPTAPQSEAPVTQKLPYAPPKATFVPLKLEERLSFLGSGCDPTTCSEGSYIK